MADEFDFQPEAESTNEFDFQPEVSPTNALDYAVKAPQSMTGSLLRTLQLGAEGADIGRRQMEKEKLADQLSTLRLQRGWGDVGQSLLGGAERGTGFVKEMEPLNLLKRTLEIPAQLSGTPYKIQPLVSPEQVRNFLVPTPEQAGSVSSGVQQAGAEFLSGFTSPDQVAALAAGGSAPELVARLFQIKTASDVPPQLQSLWEAVKTGDKSEIAKAAVSLAATAAIPASIERGTRKTNAGPKIPEFATVESPESVALRASLPAKGVETPSDLTEPSIIKPGPLNVPSGGTPEPISDQAPPAATTGGGVPTLEEYKALVKDDKPVAAATKLKDGRILEGAAHPLIQIPKGSEVESEGFVTKKGRYVSREEAAMMTGGNYWQSVLEGKQSGAAETVLAGPDEESEFEPEMEVEKFYNKVINPKTPPSVRAGEAQPSAAPGGETVETPVSAGETPQAKGEVATSPPEPQAPDVTEPVTEPLPSHVAASAPDNGRVTYRAPATGKKTRWMKWNGQWFKEVGGVTKGKPLDPDIGLTRALDLQLARESKPPEPPIQDMGGAESDMAQQLRESENITGKAASEAEKATQAWGTHVETVVNPIKAKIRQLEHDVFMMQADAKRTLPETKGKSKLTKKKFMEMYGVNSMDEANELYKRKNEEWAAAEKELEAAEEKRKELEATKERRAKEWSRAATRSGELRRQVYPKVKEGDIVGMGGAVPSEFEVPQGTPTSTKNAVVDQERVKRGLPPAIQPSRESFGEVWDKAMARIDQDPQYPDNLIQELDRHPRAPSPEENAVLLHRQIDLQNEYAKATRDLAQAFEDGRQEAVDAEKVRVSNLTDQLGKLYDLDKKVGTAAGRALNVRRMMANEDFTLAKMTMDLRAAKGGSPLSPEESVKVQELHDKIKATQDAYDDYVSRSNVKIADLQRQVSEAPKFTPPIIKAAERIVSTLDTRANAARQRLKEKMARTSVGVDPTIIADLAEIGASHIAHIGLDFAKWSSEMVKELGEWVRPHLDEAWEKSQKAIDSIQGVPAVVKEGVKTAFSRLPPEEKSQATVDAIKQRVADKKPNEITFFVQRLARDLVARGVRDRDKLIDQVHEVIKQAIPEFTKRQTMDAISGYGDFKQLSKDEISVALRGMKGEMQQLAKLEDMAKGEPPLKSGTERRTPTEAERQLVKLVNEAKFKFQVPVQDPSIQLKSALDTLKTTLTNRIKDYEDRIARGDYSARPKRELVLDPEASRLKAQNERVKKEFQKGVELERFKNAQPFERGAHWINKWRRGFILSSPITLAKLTAAAVQRMVFTPVEEAVGSGFSKAFPGLAEKAKREGGFSPSAETLAITRGITQGMSDAWSLLKTGESDLDALYGKGDPLPGSFLDFFGRVHGALKSSTKRSEFTRSMQKRIEWGRRNGVDVTDPWVQMKMGVEAYKDANRAIFMQDNRLVSGYKRLISGLEEKSKITGRVPLSGKLRATAARVLVPIVKVPTNIIAETLDYALGSVTGGARLARAYATGIENLKPEEADLILRQLKKGSIGAATLALGYFSPQVFGGYYQKGEKRKPGEAGVGAMKIFGHNIPSFLLHNPLLETLQIGATIRRVADAHTSKHDPTQKGIGEGVKAGALGLVEEQPFVREMLDLQKLFDPNQWKGFVGELGKSLTIPSIVQWIAAHTDKNRKGEIIKRAPKTIVQHIETGIPGLREKVPKKKGQ